MTNAELIAKIKAEIERRMKELDSDWMGTPAAGWAFSEILFFLDTLEEKSEKPTNLDFEQELYNRFGQVKDFTLGMRIAKYFYELGSSEKPNSHSLVEFEPAKGFDSGSVSVYHEGLDEAAEKYANYHPACFHKPMAESFKAGAEWQKEQMMKDGLDAVKSCQFDKIEKTIAGCCSSILELEYNIAREVAEALWSKNDLCNEKTLDGKVKLQLTIVRDND